jgi:hypothetical protein
MLKGFVTMISKRGEHSYETLYEFRNGVFDNRGMYADFKYNNGIWHEYGRFPLDNGVEDWVISEIRFVLD